MFACFSRYFRVKEEKAKQVKENHKVSVFLEILGRWYNDLLKEYRGYISDAYFRKWRCQHWQFYLVKSFGPCLGVIRFSIEYSFHWANRWSSSNGNSLDKCSWRYKIKRTFFWIFMHSQNRYNWMEHLARVKGHEQKRHERAAISRRLALARYQLECQTYKATFGNYS